MHEGSVSEATRTPTLRDLQIRVESARDGFADLRHRIRSVSVDLAGPRFLDNPAPAGPEVPEDAEDIQGDIPCLREAVESLERMLEALGNDVVTLEQSRYS